MVALLPAFSLARIRPWRRKSPEEIERLRRLDIHRRGRIAHGHIVDVIQSTRAGQPHLTVLYTYEVAGVTYEVGQDVTNLPQIRANASRLAGQTASVKYDPQQPTNSIIACEGWCGITLLSA